MRRPRATTRNRRTDERVRFGRRLARAALKVFRMSRTMLRKCEAPPIAPDDFERPSAQSTLTTIDHADHRAALRGGHRNRRRAAAAAQRSAHGAALAAVALQTGILALVLVDVILIGWRNDVVRALPQTASFYALLGLPVNLRGLALMASPPSTEQHEGVPILVVEGNIVNTPARPRTCRGSSSSFATPRGRKSIPGPRFRRAPSLPPGDAVAFRTRLHRRHPTHVTSSSVSSTAATWSPERADNAMARILIAEDEEALRALCARALTTDGHEVKTACDGSDALDLHRARGWALRSLADRHPHADHGRHRAGARALRAIIPP